MNFKKLKGLTIQDVIVEEHTVYDDDPSIVLWMNNGRKYRIEGGSEEGTDESSGAQRNKLTLSSINTTREKCYQNDMMPIRKEYDIAEVDEDPLMPITKISLFQTLNDVNMQGLAVIPKQVAMFIINECEKKANEIRSYETDEMVKRFKKLEYEDKLRFITSIEGEY